jgi:hypothetical protein
MLSSNRKKEHFEDIDNDIDVNDYILNTEDIDIPDNMRLNNSKFDYSSVIK